MSVLFVAGAGTDIGKTYVTAGLVRALRSLGRQVVAVKPVASGLGAWDHPDFAASDTGVLLAAQGLPITPETVGACSPWRFAAALSPDMAAARENRTLELDDLVAFHARTRAASPDGAVLVVEGVGGVMSPLTQAATGLDWLERLDCPALLVCGSYLGAISHALTACEAINARGLALAGLVVNETPASTVNLEETATVLARFAPAPVLTLRQGAQVGGEVAERWIQSANSPAGKRR